jgi:hypothetical protein
MVGAALPEGAHAAGAKPVLPSGLLTPHDASTNVDGHSRRVSSLAAEGDELGDTDEDTTTGTSSEGAVGAGIGAVKVEANRVDVPWMRGIGGRYPELAKF